mgnify:FL=1
MAVSRGHQHISDLLVNLVKNVLGSSGNEDHVFQDRVPCSLFSLTMLMTCVMPQRKEGDELELAVAIAIATALQTGPSHMTRVVGREKAVACPYPLKRRLVQLAHHTYQDSLAMDGDRISAWTKARRYAELVCLFLDREMLVDVLALRLSCKCNHEFRRFPVVATDGQLEANLVESFLTYDACRFVSSMTIATGIRMLSTDNE